MLINYNEFSVSTSAVKVSAFSYLCNIPSHIYFNKMLAFRFSNSLRIGYRDVSYFFISYCKYWSTDLKDIEC